MSPPAVSIPYMVISSISATFMAALLGIALCRSDNQLESGKLDNAQAHWRCSGTSQNLNIPHHAFIAQTNDDQLTCNANMGCCTI